MFLYWPFGWGPVSLVQLGKKSKYTLACSVLRNVAAQVYTYFFITSLIKASHPKGKYTRLIKLTLLHYN